MILTILESLAAEPSTKRKLELLQGFDNLQDLKRVYELALDKVRFNYNIRQIPEYSTRDYKLTLRDALSMLEELQTLRGYAGRDYLIDVLGSLSKNDQEVIKRIIQRDLKCGVGRTMVNKVWKDLITKPPYMRCNRDNYMGKVLEVQFNDLSKARDSDTYSLMHPRFICFRDDKDETDTLEKALEIRQMAMRLV